MVAICGMVFSQIMVANKLPPSAGLVANNFNLSSVNSKSSLVASAVNPVFNLADILGARSLPSSVDPIRKTSGLSSRMRLVMA